MRRLLVVIALAACDAPEVAPPMATSWVVAPPSPAWPIGAVRGRLGRSQAPQLVERDGITGDAGEAGEPLEQPAVWAVPGPGPARAVVDGRLAGGRAIELVDVDTGRVQWRDRAACDGPVVGVTARMIACGGAHGVRVLGLDDKPRWRSDAALVAMTGDLLVVAARGGGLVLHDDAAGRDDAVALPKAIAADTVLAACGAGELFASTADGNLVRVAGMPLAVTWAVPVGPVVDLDACAGPTVLVTTASAPGGGRSLVAIARGTGKITGRVEGVLGSWPARDGSDRLEISTSSGVARWPRDLAAPGAPVALPVLRELLASRGERRLVRATTHTAALLDASGVRAYLPAAQLAAVLGDHHVLAASWRGAPGDTVHRFAIPPRYRPALRVPLVVPALGVPAPLRDLPLVTPFDETQALPATATGPLAAIALDPGEPGVLYVAGADGALSRADLAAGAWRWTRPGACPPGARDPLALGDELVACAAGGRVWASDKVTGAARWQWTTGHVDALAAAGDVVLAFDADRLTVLDAHDGHVLATFASDDGAAMRAAAVSVVETDWLVTYERGHLVARLPRAAFLPAWSLAVDGVVRALAPAGDGVLVVLEDGDAYRVALPTGAIHAVAGLGLAWRAEAGAISGDAAGEPLPPAHMPVPPPEIKKPRLPPSPENPPAIATPWLVPPPGPAAWQLAIYELGGSLRTRNDYALPPPVVHAVRSAAASPLVVASGPDLRDVLVLDATTGDPLRRVHLPDEAAARALFSTSVAGKPVAGIVLANPLRVVFF